jgi:hypothetical protein
MIAPDLNILCTQMKEDFLASRETSAVELTRDRCLLRS